MYDWIRYRWITLVFLVKCKINVLNLTSIVSDNNSINNNEDSDRDKNTNNSNNSILSNTSIENVITLVKQSDGVLFIGGISYLQEAETRDRSEIELPINQSLLFKYIVSAVGSGSSGNNKKPIISVLTYGGPTIDKYLFNNSNAIIGAGYSGQMFGEGLITLLNGTYAPVGRIVTTWYQSTNQLPNMINYDMMYPPGRTYKYLTQLPIYSFGFGLSYVNFIYSNLVLSNTNNATINPCDNIMLSFNIKNNGNNITNYNNNVDEISQVYLIILNNTFVETDNIRLVNFTRSNQVKLNETRQIKLMILAEQMTVTKDFQYTQIIQTGQYQVIVTSSLILDVNRQYNNNNQNMLKQTFTISGNTTPLSKCT